ncbi:hypothetical protein XH84_10310 [Bradyrhizobium nanningense]|nr:hypothetical protein XH84_10310 [Bradyrhizobium nanningense]
MEWPTSSSRERKGSSVLQIAFDCDLLLGIKACSRVQPPSYGRDLVPQECWIDESAAHDRHVRNSLERSVG